MAPRAVYYLDNSATTRPRPEAVAAVTAALTEGFGNPSSLHGLGAAAERMLKQARSQVAALIDAPPGSIYFTSGGTEANNLAILGAARQYAGRGKHIITTAVEHAAVLAPCQALEREGYRITYLPVDEQGRVTVEQVEAALTDETILVSIMWTNNEIGSIMPVEEIGRLLKARPKTLFHIDAVQAAGKLPISVGRAGCDLLTLSAHKLHGPKGVGALYVRQGVRLEPLQYGGGQEAGVRAGTENLPGIAGFGAAAALARQEAAGGAASERVRGLKLALLEGLRKAGLAFVVNGPDPEAEWAAPHILNLSFDGIDRGEVLVHALEQHGVYVSTRSACHSRRETNSHVLEALGCTGDRAGGAIRISFSPLSREETVAGFLRAAQVAVPELQSVTAGRAPRRRH